MNKQQRQELEDMVRQLAEEPYNPSEKHIEEIKKRAFEEYEQIMAAKQKMKEKRKGTLRRVVVTAAAIVCLLVGSTVIALLNPLQSGNADNFFRRAVIWVNDQLHLGIELPVLEESVNKKAEFSVGYTADKIEGQTKFLDIPVFFLEESSSIHLDMIEIETNEYSNEKIASLRYNTDSGKIVIISHQGTDSNNITIQSDTAITLNLKIGDVIVWSTGETAKAIISSDDVYAFIMGEMQMKELADYCSKLNIIN